MTDSSHPEVRAYVADIHIEHLEDRHVVALLADRDALVGKVTELNGRLRARVAGERAAWQAAQQSESAGSGKTPAKLDAQQSETRACEDCGHTPGTCPECID